MNITCKVCLLRTLTPSKTTSKNKGMCIHECTGATKFIWPPFP